jgi:NADPH:quinone reductase-like Zn-dependent oxidoreductase
MRAWVSDRYGGPEVLQLAEVAQPAPRAGEVLLKVHALSVNPADWRCLRATPAFARATLGWFRPKYTVLGGDVAGTVEAVGPDVTAFKAGDEVYANLLDTGFGGFADYAAVQVGVMALKPKNLSFEEAAAIPMAAVTAFEGFRHHGDIQPGQTVLVNGASGGVGHFGVQIAKAAGAVVTGVTSTRNIDFVRSLGADHVVDYTTTDFTRAGQTYDRILDAIGNRTVSELKRALSPSGTCAVTGFTTIGRLLGVGLLGGKAIASVTAHANTANLTLLRDMAEAGTLQPMIDRRFAFEDLPAAITYLETMRARGKVVVRL